MARPREFDEDSVVAAARDRFWDAGYAATSLSDLTSATGLGRASLYGAFGDKHALYLRIFDDYIAGAVRSVHDDLAGDDQGALERIRTHLLENARASAGNPRGCLLARGTAELAGRDDDVAARSTQAHEDLALEYANAVRAAQRAGDVDPTADAATLGRLLLMIHRGTEALGRGGMSEAPLRATVEAALTALP
ncbi:TetR/AcrR family transcriptional regulator [Solirubrobacter phytolaccae]|uniref:TetR/AcrR family transcriptional regulator n=1 Tax=Solirubrobacter phytolaccae TaxID=1404360 RepID=A0A9X3SDS3_9ACTN|nr:TetR/AcrR family transcriptional regulator [Solirubrobacter phytolaccae]MDA0184010.1 TetR/AcrR family transcriptional regulator [Solirubrobacter phytolaccae]